MIKTFFTRAKQGYRTMKYPDAAPPALPETFRGAPVVDAAKCRDGCHECVDACPTDAIHLVAGKPAIDLGRCIFCPGCADACPEDAISYSKDYRLAASRREDLMLDPGEELRLASELPEKILSLFGRSLKLRVVSAGDCNACASDVNVLSTVGWDLGRFGIQIVAAPRHADALLVVGPVTANMRLALQKTWDAIAPPKIVIAVGACAISGGIYSGHADQSNGVPPELPIDLYIPGCPPHPLTILDGLLRTLGKVK